MYICDFSRSVGAGSATTRNTRGLTRSVIRLDRAALAGRVAPLEDDADLRSRSLDPFLQGNELAVQAPHLLLVVLAFHLPRPDIGCWRTLADAIASVPSRLRRRRSIRYFSRRRFCFPFAFCFLFLVLPISLTSEGSVTHSDVCSELTMHRR